MQAGGTCEINYELGSDGIDDLQASITRVRPEGAITVTKDASNHKFVVAASDAGGAIISITSGRHQEANTTVTIAIHAAAQTLSPSIYGYENGSTINTVIGANPIRIYFYQGSTGALTITASSSGHVSLDVGDDYVDVTPLTAGTITLTFENTEMEFLQTLTLAIAERPAVVTMPTVNFPDRVEGFYKDDVRRYDYVLGNDNTDNLTVTSSNQSVATVDIDRANKKIVITAQSASDGTATVTVSKPDTDWSQSVVVYVDESYEVIAPKINYYQIHGSSAVNISSGQTSASVSVEGKRIYVNASMGRRKNGSVIYTRIVSSDQTVIAVTGKVYTGTISLIPVSEGSATVSFYNSDTNALIFALGVSVTEATEDAGVPVINGLAWVDGTFSRIPSENESYIAIPSDSTSYNVNLPLDKYLLLDIDEAAAEVSISSDNDSIAEYELMGGGRGVAGNNMIVPHAVGSTVIRFTSPGLSWSFNLNVAVVGTSSEGGSNTPASLPEITSSSHDGTYYLKGTVDGVTNPVFAHDSLGTGVAIIHKTNNNEIYCYNESEGTVSIDTVHTLSDVSTLGQTIVNALTTYGVAAATYTTTTSQPDSPVGYALYSPASQGNTWGGLSEFSSSAESGFYVLKGDANAINPTTGASSAENVVVFINMSTMKISAVKNGQTPAYMFSYSQSTEQASDDINGGYANMEVVAAIEVAEGYGLEFTANTGYDSLRSYLSKSDLNGYLDGTSYENT